MSFAIAVTSTTESGADGATKTVTTTVVTPQDTPVPAPAAQEAAADPATVLATKWPRSAKDITVEWLTALMGAEVASYDEIILDNGALSDAIILKLKYAGKAGKMPSVVLKYAKGEEVARKSSVVSRSYEKECLVYSELTGKLPLTLPDVYGVWRDEENPNEWFCIAMEDLSVEHDVMDQIKGITFQDQKMLMEDIATFNAQFYGSDLLELEWLSPGDLTDGYKPWYGLWFDTFEKDPNGFNVAVEYLKRKPQSAVGATEAFPGGDPYFLKVVDYMMGPKGIPTIKKWFNILATRPITLCHCDARSDNIFKSKSTGKFTFIDWQMVAAAPVGVELSTMCTASMADEADYEKIPELLENYYRVLKEKAPDMCAGYSIDEVRMDYGLGMLTLYFGAMALFGPIFKDLPMEHPLWTLFSVWLPRQILTGKAIGLLESLEAVGATL